MSEQIQNQIGELLFLALEREISKEQICTLNNLIKNNPERIRYAVNYLQVNSALKLSKTVANMKKPGTSNDNLDADSLTESLVQMAEFEKTAPTIDIPEEKPLMELPRKVVYPPREKRKVSKFNVVFLALNAAAILFIVLFLKFAPPKSGVEVATLTDSIDAKWVDVTGSMEMGTRLTTSSEGLSLQEGLAELLFDNNAKLVIEGPAEFGLLAEDQIDLRYGRIYTTVPREAAGFTVTTPTSRFVDLGTEFGVQSEVNGSAELHVIKGKVQLFAASNDGSKTSQLVTENKAVRYDANRKSVKEIAVEKEVFVRAIDSSSGSVWRGQKRLSLADMAAGGNGLGTGDYRNKVDYFNGETFQAGKYLHVDRNDRKYVTANNPLIDGVFIPDGGKSGHAIVSSKGDVYDGCPDTCGIGSRIIVNHIRRATSPGEKEGPEYPIVLDGKSYGTIGNPSLFMHANNAMTFDLENIRKKHPGLTIRSFSALCGLNDTLLSMSFSEPEKVSAEFIVLVDGQQRYRKLSYSGDTATAVNVKIEPDDRFLTLMVTDGRGGEDYDSSRQRDRVSSNDHDQCIWARPFLEVEPTLVLK